MYFFYKIKSPFGKAVSISFYSQLYFWQNNSNMKKCISILVILFALFVNRTSAQENSLGASNDFMQLLIQMNKELVGPKTVGSWEMLQNLDYKIDDELAHKYLLDGNEYTKIEESECYPIGFVLNKSEGIATLFFFRGPATSLFFFVNVVTYNYKKGKLIDQLSMVAGFAKENSACSLFVQNPNLIILTTLAGSDQTKIELKINNKGKIDRN
jgi:hypothetical protein